MQSEYLECTLIAARIPSEIWLEGVWNVVRIHLECSQNAPRMADEYGSNVQEFKQNAARILRMYLECNTNVPSVSRMPPEWSPIDSGSNRDAFEVHSGSFEAHSGHSGRIV